MNSLAFVADMVYRRVDGGVANRALSVLPDVGAGGLAAYGGQPSRAYTLLQLFW